MSYRIRVVAEMTGVPTATLRGWERRYGIPAPARSASAYRLYTDRDVEAIRRLVRHKGAGLSTAEAAGAVRRWLESEGDAVPEQNVATASDGYDRLRRELFDAVRAFDYEALRAGIARMLFVGNASSIFERVLAPLQVEIGIQWHQGALSVGQEHMATHLLETAARDLLRLLEVPDGATDIVLACYPHEDHALPLYGVAFRSVRAGLHPIILGSRTPPSAIAACIAARHVGVVGLSLTVPPEAHVVRAQTEEFVAAAGGVPVVVGGPGARAMASVIEAAGATVIEGGGATAAARLLSVVRGAPKRTDA